MQQISFIPASIQIAEGIRLCGNQPELYFRLLSLFPSDPSVPRLEESLAKGDIPSAFRHAHTLKGLCAQLALPALQEDARIVCDILRNTDTKSLSDAKEMLPVLKADYRTICSDIHRLLNRDLP